jgi:hypothetical protein
MPQYAFVPVDDKFESGIEVLKFYPMRLAPKIGSIVEIDGVQCRRIASSQRPFTDDQRKFPKYPYRARSLARKDHLPKSVRDSSKFTKDGTLIIRNAEHERRVGGIMDLERA